MAMLAFNGRTYRGENEVRAVLSDFGIPYERWGLRPHPPVRDDEVLAAYAPEVERLSRQRGYQSADLVALSPATPGLDTLLRKFNQEHHHTDDEVRFTVAGTGVFEINTSADQRLKFTAEPGDLIVIPAYRRHLFYLTEALSIRCIRLFVSPTGWAAVYDQNGGRFR